MESIPSEDGTLCVDLFEGPSGKFGFEHLRADVEDSGRWSIVGGFSSARYASPLDAALAARDAVHWLGEGQPLRSWNAWCAHLKAT